MNRKAVRGRLDVYQLAPVLHQEADFVRLQVVLLSEHKIRRHHRRVYRATQERLTQLWAAYTAGTITTSKMLLSCSHLNGPAACRLGLLMESSNRFYL